MNLMMSLRSQATDSEFALHSLTKCAAGGGRRKPADGGAAGETEVQQEMRVGFRNPLRGFKQPSAGAQKAQPEEQKAKKEACGAMCNGEGGCKRANGVMACKLSWRLQNMGDKSVQCVDGEEMGLKNAHGVDIQSQSGEHVVLGVTCGSDTVHLLACDDQVNLAERQTGLVAELIQELSVGSLKGMGVKNVAFLNFGGATLNLASHTAKMSAGSKATGGQSVAAKEKGDAGGKGKAKRPAKHSNDTTKKEEHKGMTTQQSTTKTETGSAEGGEQLAPSAMDKVAGLLCKAEHNFDTLKCVFGQEGLSDTLVEKYGRESMGVVELAEHIGNSSLSGEEFLVVADGAGIGLVHLDATNTSLLRIVVLRETVDHFYWCPGLTFHLCQVLVSNESAALGIKAVDLPFLSVGRGLRKSRKAEGKEPAKPAESSREGLSVAEAA